MVELFANSGHPNQKPYSTTSDLGLHCFQLPVLESPVFNGVSLSMLGKSFSRRHFEMFLINMICLVKDHSTKISVKLLSNFCNVVAIYLNFHFSHCKFIIDILSCHSNQKCICNSNKKKKTQKKNNIFLEVNVA